MIFFDGERGADNDADLLRLRDRFSELRSQDVKVVGVTAAIPQVNRAAMERAGANFPFPLVSDVDPQSPEGTLRIHRHWGRLDAVTKKPLSGAFSDRSQRAGRLRRTDTKTVRQRRSNHRFDREVTRQRSVRSRAFDATAILAICINCTASRQFISRS